MRFTKVSIDGYGRFAKKDVPLIAGLQIVTGPNEQGKSTLRNYIADMLYGQKRGNSPNEYDDSHEIRTPWNDPKIYGGRLEYSLDSGRGIEVRRKFGHDDESVQIFDINDDREVTNEFTRLPNQEPAFADRHLGMCKDVFLGMATISHMTLDDLGDQQALMHIREKLLSLTDSGDGVASAEHALAWLADRAARIGNSRSGGHPLGLAKARMKELEEELQQASTLREQVSHLEDERYRVTQRLGDSLRQRERLQHQLVSYELADNCERLRKAEELTERIDSLTKASFRKNALRDFPLEQAEPLQKAYALVAATESQLREAERDLEDSIQEVERSNNRLGDDDTLSMGDLSPDYDTKLTELDRLNRQRLQEVEGVEKVANNAKTRMDEAQSQLKQLPDFSQVAADPVEWISEQSGSFAVAQRTRDNEKAKRSHLKKTIAQKREEWKTLDVVFSQVEDFHSEAREFTVKTAENVEALSQLEHASEAASARIEDLQSKLPAYALTSVLSSGAVIFFSAMSYFTANFGILIPALFFGLMFVGVFLGVIITRQGSRKAEKEIENLTQKMASARLADLNARELIEGLMSDANCQTIWELEALHDRYSQETAELTVFDEQYADQDRRTQEATDRVTDHLKRLRKHFSEMGEQVNDEGAVSQAATSAISRYQEYRDAKRRASEGRELYERKSKELEGLRAELEESQKEERDLSLEVRKTLRENHYPGEKNCDTALKAIQAYRIKSAQYRQAQRSIDMLHGKVEVNRDQIEERKRSLRDHRSALSGVLKKANVKTMDEFTRRSEEARKFQEEWGQRASMEEQLSTVLGSEDLTSLRSSVATMDEEISEPNSRPVSEVRNEIAELELAVEEMRKQEHDLHVTIAESSGGVRSLNEIEEELSHAELKVQGLQMELEATSYAAALLEETAREQHARVAPQLSTLASAYLDEITDGAYDAITISPNVEIGVRIPQTDSVRTDADLRLSKGTVDQIYLALRLAMIQNMSDKGERIPMLLDDPFANYDDERLFRAMKVLARVAENNQILLFTCREDVVRAARKIKATVIHL